ncbi:hypothetical protein [Streptomyces sp. NBC_00691]|uniref:hypothetical protein n=1 Tax=Streptomyces sp. NBC_00691 TaxID=2903671 RepID=UPI002E3339F1|nr:hypothetical protein [Streptomyces sp. NBC_00691]
MGKVTLFSEPNYGGKSWEIPVDGETYTRAATGLDKIASIKIDQSQGRTRTYCVALYGKLPKSPADFEDSQCEKFEEDTPDTGEAAGNGWIRASVRTEEFNKQADYFAGE